MLASRSTVQTVPAISPRVLPSAGDPPRSAYQPSSHKTSTAAGRIATIAAATPMSLRRRDMLDERCTRYASPVGYRKRNDDDGSRTMPSAVWPESVRGPPVKKVADG